jgi:Cu(I)/Ag(I) efflux system membrane fusion protein
MKKAFIFFLFVSISFVISCRQKNETAAQSDIYYTCSMDPQVVESKPGKCPICKMDLTPVKKTNGNMDELELSEQQILLGNIQADTIRLGRIGDQMVLTATLNFDQMKAVSVSSRVMGRVERLYYKNVGDLVPRGAPLFDIYSEDLNNAKQEYLLAVERKKVFAGETVIDFDQLLKSAKNKLLLWGMSESQILELEKSRNAKATTTIYSSASGYITELALNEGDYVMEGGTVVKLADLSTLWAEAQVYTTQMGLMDQGSMAIVQLPDLDGKEIRGKIEFVNPEIDPATRINLVRVSIPNPGLQLKPGMPAYVILKSPVRNTISLPIDAVIRNEDGATVWLQQGPLRFRNVMVQTGMETGDRIEILSGLKEGDVVVSSGAYLLHSEYVFRKGSDPMAGHNH